MPPTRLTPQQEEILEALARKPREADIGQIIDSLAAPPHRRTVQRRLAELVAGKHVQVVGKGKARLYKLAPSANRGRPPAAAAPGAGKGYDAYIPVSAAGREIIAYVRQPRAGRLPAGYERNFLASYIPNQTAYLSESLRAHLHHVGITDGRARPAGTYGRAIFNRLLIDFSWSSSRLEGNTYSRLDTERLIEFGQYAEGKDAQEAQMILNHKGAIELLVDEADGIGFDPYTFLGLHGLLSENLMPDPEASGRLRRRPVHIGGSVYMPLAVPQLIEECFREILHKAAAIIDPFEQAFFVMVHLPYLQPFEDVNKRVSRLGANIPLIKHNLCPLTFLDVPERAYIDALLGVYEMNRYELLRDVFAWAYERSANEYSAVRKSLADPDPLRLRYRKELCELVGDIVRNRRLNAAEVIARYADEHIDGKNRDAFVEVVKEELKRLHEGVLARYRIRASEFAAWLITRRAGQNGRPGP
ncbi:Fic family protein [Desulfurivibrio sp. D14AmB]|uniref:Fic family protein n=1 Tax=Desulfurivibrio sp. D14AmB TaxID=3374370 RepID=UPI00376EAE11